MRITDPGTTLPPQVPPPPKVSVVTPFESKLSMPSTGSVITSWQQNSFFSALGLITIGEQATLLLDLGLTTIEIGGASSCRLCCRASELLYPLVIITSKFFVDLSSSFLWCVFEPSLSYMKRAVSWSRWSAVNDLSAGSVSLCGWNFWFRFKCSVSLGTLCGP